MRVLWPWAFLFLLLPLGLFFLGLFGERRILGRVLSLTLCVLALAQPELSLHQEKERIVFAVDRSASVGDSAIPVFWDLARSAAERGAAIGVVTFAGNAGAVRMPEAGLPRSLDSPMELASDRTDLGEALTLAMSLLEGRGQIVLITDGRDTEGKLWAAVAQARAQGVPIHVFPVGKDDVLKLYSFRGPQAVSPKAQAELRGVLFATRALSVKAELFLGGELVESRDLFVEPGETEITFYLSFPKEGVYWAELVLECPEDQVLENNRLAWAVQVGEVPQILVVGEEASLVDVALRGMGLSFRRIPVLRPEDLSGVGLVILDDYPLGFLGPQVIATLRAFAEEGGGIFVVQGRRALSGYAGPLEEILPVTYAVPEEVEEATAAVVFVLDRSASMAGRAGPSTKLDLLKEATATAAELMPPKDWLGAVAFDRNPFWLAFPGPAEEVRPALFSALAGLTPSGGTDLWPAVLLALSALQNVPARIRHMIIISDGKTVRENRDFSGLYGQVEKSGVGVSCIAIGPDADLEILGGLAQAGGGELRVLADPQDLRAVLVQETKRALRPRFVEGEFPVQLGPAALAPEELPPVYGYALTFPKPTAEVALLMPAGDPLLAFWSLGLGTVAVLNTDLRGGWTKNWTNNPEWFSHFSRLLEKLWPRRSPANLSWEVQGSKILLRLDVAEGGHWVNGLHFSGELSGPQGSQELAFHQIAPGRYEAEAVHPGYGAYLLSYAEESGRFGGQALVPLPYSPEYAELGPDKEVLGRIARLTGGIVLEDEEIPERTDLVQEWLPLWPVLLWAAAASFLGDLALRKLLPRKYAKG
jgi:Mg-chelatase subunit ChlD